VKYSSLRSTGQADNGGGSLLSRCSLSSALSSAGAGASSDTSGGWCAGSSLTDSVFAELSDVELGSTRMRSALLEMASRENELEKQNGSACGSLARVRDAAVGLR